jgi:hypothetical protein
VGAQLEASQEGLSSMKLVSYFITVLFIKIFALLTMNIYIYIYIYIYIRVCVCFFSHCEFVSPFVAIEFLLVS